MTIDLSAVLPAVLQRLCDMEKAVYPGSDAVPVHFYAQEATPYWTNRFDGFTITDTSIDYQSAIYRITATLVLASVTEGYDQQAETMIQTWLPVVLLYFGQRRQLKRTVADAALDFLGADGASITGGQADYGIPASTAGQSMFGIDFTFEIPMDLPTDQVIF